GLARSAHAVDLQPAIDRRGVDGDVARQLHGEPYRDVVLLHTTNVIIATVVAAALARVPEGADRQPALGQDGNELYALWVGVAPTLLGLDDEAVARPGDDVDRPVGIANPDALSRFDEDTVVPRVADFAAVAKEVAGFP